MITHARLLELISYNPTNGEFRLRIDSPRRKAGRLLHLNRIVQRHAGSAQTRQTYIFLENKCSVLAGRLAWFYMTGLWPDHEIDHRDNDGWNHRWGNLRPATRSQNQANVRRYKSNSSGLKCVFPSGGKARPWRAQVQKDGKRISLGRFETKEAAFAAYAMATTSQHGEFARLA